MKDPVYVTEVAERKWVWPSRSVRLPVFEPRPQDLDGQIRWSERYYWRFNYHVHKDDLDKAKALAQKLWDLGENPNLVEEARLIIELCMIEETPYDKKTDVEKWAHMAVQIPGDIGGPNKDKIREILASKAFGNVLETMCGFNSYFDPTPQITGVVALDYCREMLERYQYPKRIRILYDLERVVRGEKMKFFADKSFQIVGCWGSNYLSNPVPVFAEFNRILSNDGRLLILESTSEGYRDLIKRFFNPEECAKFIREAGLSPKITHLSIKQKREFGKYYLVEGTKP